MIQEAADLHLEVQRRLLDLFSGGAGGSWVLYTALIWTPLPMRAYLQSRVCRIPASAGF